MKLLKKRWFAILVAVVMIVAALAISFSRTHSTTDYQPESASAARRWGEEHAGAYEKFLSDGAGFFSSGALEDMAAENGALDYRFGTILGVATVNAVSGDMGTVAYNVSDQLGLGESDFLLLLDAQYTRSEYERNRGFGHSTIPRSAAIARCCGAEQALLIHHDPTRTDRQLLALEATVRAQHPNVRFGRGGEEVFL